jgi:hypothetical protein
MTDKDFEGDELITVELPRSEYKLLKEMIARQEAYNWLTSRLKNSWLWVVGGGILTIWMLYDKFHVVTGVIK